MENNPKLKENWKETKEKLKHKFTMLTESDVFLEDGKQKDMLDRIQIKYKITREELFNIIKAI